MFEHALNAVFLKHLRDLEGNYITIEALLKYTRRTMIHKDLVVDQVQREADLRTRRVGVSRRGSAARPVGVFRRARVSDLVAYRSSSGAALSS